MVFDKGWFIQHQSKLLFLLRFKLFRKVLKIETDKKIVEILPNCVTVGLENNQYQTTFYTRDVFSKYLYHIFSPIWWVMHFLDWLFIDKFIPKFSFGFLTLTVNPDPNPETSTVDGFVQKFTAGLTWAQTIAAATGDTADDTATQGVLVQNRLTGTDFINNRAFWLFNTSSLTSGAIISAATLSVVPHDAAGGTNPDSLTLEIVSSNPASNTTLGTADYNTLGSTSFGSITFWTVSDSTYRDITLNANGIANISKTGISKFGGKGSADLNGTPTPTGNNQVLARWADYGGAVKPKLVVTYSTFISPFPSHYNG